ncbi:MAG: HAD-IIB family hydrolase [Halothiobacillaceae bacterium]|jgi:HAD superfamily hydrolase (TIGR01484 family)|nr:HAD-IIB family hydrolase [Halothiobacillaceae bacterium]MDY0049568.1 HAD-IIB family hydrolase [Halothiobacillaceae bacterium]
MNDPILLCSDLDRTLLPNGSAPESPDARTRVRRLAERPEIILAYVSGRDLNRVEYAIREYDLPRPAHVIADVGSSLYRDQGHTWQLEQGWIDEIAPDFAGFTAVELRGMLGELPGLEPQEASKQGAFKLSFYVDPKRPRDPLLLTLQTRLWEEGVRANLIYSIDEPSGTGLLDILPERANKRQAIEYLMREAGIDLNRTLFAGDSGNDLDVLVSPIPSVLVRNAQASVREEALRQITATGRPESLYLAQGGLFGMNGHYAAGVLEGLAHFLPETRPWMRLPSDT